MQIWAAVDILAGRVVSLVRGSTSAPMEWQTDPLTAAKRWEREGADGLHLVDLDRAFGSSTNWNAIGRILDAVSLPVQVGGGIRSVADAVQVLDAGASRVVVGTMAFTQPGELRQLLADRGADSVVVASDHKGGVVLSHGWRSRETMNVFEAGKYLEDLGVIRVVVTDTDRDGTAQGPDLETYGKLKETTGMRILASGGIRSSVDVKNLEKLGVEGAILGRALYEGSIRLSRARSVPP